MFLVLLVYLALYLALRLRSVQSALCVDLVLYLALHSALRVCVPGTVC